MLQDHINRTMDDWPEAIAVPIFICRIGRMVGLSPEHSAYIPFLYGFQHAMFDGASLDFSQFLQALMMGYQSKLICDNIGFK